MSNKVLLPKFGFTADDALTFNRRRHTSSRKMAWAAFYAMLGITLYILIRIPPEYVGNYDGLLGYVMVPLSTIILGYMGITTWGSNDFLKRGSEEIDGSTEKTTSTNTPAG